MVECAKCGKKLGFFSSKHDYEDSKGNPLKYCDDCHEKEEEKERKRIEKEQAELKKKVFPMIINFINILGDEKLVQLHRIYINKNLFSMIEDESLEELRDYLHNQIKLGHKAATQGWMDFGTGYNPADHIDEFELALVILQDLERVKNVIDRKGFKLTFPLLVTWAGELIQKAAQQHKQNAEEDFENSIAAGTDGPESCSGCGEPIKSGAKFCKHCGAKQ